MAVYAAHLTRTLQGTPSIFQVTAQEALAATVKPALRKVIQFISGQYPNKLGWCADWYDELFLLVDACLQYHYLQHYAASFSESFYGLLRVPLSVSDEFNSGQRLPALLEYGSLAVLVLLPYLRDKAEKLVQKWREDQEDGRLDKSPTNRLRAAAIKLYSIIHLVVETAKLIQLGRYLTGTARSHSLSLAALSLRLNNAPPANDDTDTWTDLLTNIRTGNYRSAVVTFPMVGGLMLRGVQYGAFLVQFLRWWDTNQQHHHEPTVVPPPPQRDERSLRWQNRCPLCLQHWKTPTVLPVSGYVFCYMCISKHVRSTGTCPVTKYPVTEDSLVRMYVDT